ncbi:hypothetical protein BDP27DRAFT_1323306 [Rhodocollybia butyracea]|uniref:Uncharacterized protein n=1 Tax=Rhodocollybia butyracea TaxID=206335 RepID=A0A9P5PZ74_9AGAR|nr:hypothetical protein BDP27DRAFT_1323306 [Rhodocollybia butyracea]
MGARHSAAYAQMHRNTQERYFRLILAPWNTLLCSNPIQRTIPWQLCLSKIFAWTSACSISHTISFKAFCSLLASYSIHFILPVVDYVCVPERRKQGKF